MTEITPELLQKVASESLYTLEQVEMVARRFPHWDAATLTQFVAFASAIGAKSPPSAALAWEAASAAYRQVIKASLEMKSPRWMQADL